MLSYPTLDEKSESMFFGLSNLYPDYVFSSKEPEMIVPLNWRLNSARGDMPKRLYCNSGVVLSIPKIAGYQYCGFEFLMAMTLDEISDENIRNSLGLIDDFDDDDFDD